MAGWLVAVLSGCTNSDGDGEAAPTSGEVSPDATTQPSSSEGTAPPSIPDVEPVLAGMAQVTTLTPVLVESLRPSLEWEPIADAALYRVVVLADGGEPYWMWSGSDPSVEVGGAAFSEFGNGPIIGTDFSWSVAAFDEAGTLIAVSGRLPISSGAP